MERSTRKSERLKERIVAESKVDVTQRKSERKRKRKRKRKDEINPDTPWAPVWKPIEECRQYKNGMITSFVDDDNNWDDYLPLSKKCNFDLNRFLKQVRETRGYEVDADAPDFVCSPFNLQYTHADIIRRMSICSDFNKSFTDEMNFVLAEINTQAEPHGKKYELHKVERFVVVSGNRCDLITFGVNEFNVIQKVAIDLHREKTIQAMVFLAPDFKLLEWRFKPEAREL